MRNLLFAAIFTFFTFASTQASEVVLITGASRGLGLSIAEILTKAGYIVYAGHRANSSLEKLEEIQKSSPHLHPLLMDVTDQESVDKAIAVIMTEEGHIDALINNAGILITGSLENLTIEEAKLIFDVNFFGMTRVTQAVLPIMRVQKKGRIIQISSRSGFRPLPHISFYAASKFALEGCSETLAAALKPWNIHISLIEPGPMDTEMDQLARYGSRLAFEEDPYGSIFQSAGLLESDPQSAQSTREVALIVKEALEAEHPYFRYQTTEKIKDQAAMRLVDITGQTAIEEWASILFPENK
jgi:NAD(P)-dependent dehydrogenase (short-subunit alcohol dehydrogenase family)